jgi:predicted MFS family arabinose efflux permease
MPAIFAVGLAVFAVGVDTYIVAAVLPAIADDLREPISNVGLLASAYNLPTAILAPLFGPLSDRRGRRFALLLGLAIFAVAAAACIVAPSLPLLLAARAINGFGAAIILPAALAWAGDLPTLRERGRAIGIISGAFPLATLIGLPIGAVATSLAGWRAPFAFIVAVAILGFVGVLRLREAPRAPGPVVSLLSSYRRVFGDRRALAIVSVTFVWFAGTMGLFIYVAEFIHESFAIPTDRAGLIYVVVGLVGVIATRTSGRLISTVGPRRAVLGGIAVFVVAALILPLTKVSLPLAVVVFGCWAFGTWFAIPGQQTIVAGLSNSARGMMLALNASALNLGGVFGPFLTGRMIDIGGFALAGPWASSLGVVALVMAWFFLPRSMASGATTDAPTDALTDGATPEATAKRGVDIEPIDPAV